MFDTVVAVAQVKLQVFRACGGGNCKLFFCLCVVGCPGALLSGVIPFLFLKKTTASFVNVEEIACVSLDQYGAFLESRL